jgi:hypothetical protein
LKKKTKPFSWVRLPSPYTFSVDKRVVVSYEFFYACKIKVQMQYERRCVFTTTTYIQVKASNEHRNNSSFSRKNHVVTELMLRKLMTEISQSCTAIWMYGFLDELHAMDVWMDGWMDRLMDERIIASIFFT